MKKDRDRYPTNVKKGHSILSKIGAILLTFSLLLGTAMSVSAEDAAKKWEGQDPTNKDAVINGATMEQFVSPVPEEYRAGMENDLLTFLVYQLDHQGHGFNEQFGTDYYLAFSVDKKGEDKTVKVVLADMSMKSVVAEKRVKPGETVQFEQLKRGSYKFEIDYQKTAANYQIQVRSGVGGTDNETVVYSQIASSIGQ